MLYYLSRVVWRSTLLNKLKRVRERYQVLGYKYEDIQQFGSVLEWAELYIPESNTQVREGLVKIWDFFEGVLAEGYVEGEENE